MRYIDGNRDHPLNKGVICGKGASGIMQHCSPARLRAPMKRVGPRGSGEFQEITWEEALSLATEWMGKVRKTDPKRLAFFTGRDQSQSLTGFWAMKFGTPNFAAHGGFCSVNMAAGGLYTFGGAFWEFGDPDWEHTKYFLLFRRGGGSCLQPHQDRHRQAEGTRRQDRVDQPGAHGLQRGGRRMGGRAAGDGWSFSWAR